MRTLQLFLLLALPCAAMAQPIDVPITITNPERPTGTISPLIYGLNAYVYDSEWGGGEWKVGLDNHASNLNVTNRRMGGNALTSYNWENGFNNAGNDDNHSNNIFVSYITGSGTAPYGPAEALMQFHSHSVQMGTYSLLQLPAAGYVAADGNGPVSAGESAPSSRWKAVVFDKPGPFTITPDLNDDVVYVDESINYLMTTFGPGASALGLDAYELDNEPGLWHHYRTPQGDEGTHSRLHPQLLTAGELLERNIALARTIRRMDGTAEIYGPAMWGYPEFYSLWNVWDGQSHVPSDWATYNVEPYRTNNTGDEYRYNHMTWVNAYLAKMKEASDAAGRRLLDVFSFHYYPAPEVANTDAQIMQAPRSLYDPTFVEQSWITQSGNGFTDGRAIELIPKMQQSITDFYPGTKLAITEYSFGGRHSAAGGVAQVDALGAFGKTGVYAANYFFTVDDYIAAAFRLYRNYDGNNSTFGDKLVAATTSDISNANVYASTDQSGRLHLILLNRNTTRNVNALLQLTSDQTWRRVEAYTFDGSSSTIRRTADKEMTANSLSYELPPMSAHHLVVYPASSSVEPAATTSTALAMLPNPLRDNGTLVVSLSAPSQVTVTLHDVLGNTVATLLDEQRDAGMVNVPFDATSLPSGEYTARVVAGGVVMTTGVTVLR